MKLTVVVFTLLLLAGVLLPGCSKEQVLDVYSDAVELAGNVGLTNGLFLEGKREFGEDRYTGTYKVDYVNYTGEECPFGGTMLDKRAQEHVEVTCTVESQGGAVSLVWNCGGADPVVLAEGDGTFTETCYLAPGSNYFNILCEDFTGSVDLTIE